jgi:splicing factor 3B subunit 2
VLPQVLHDAFFKYQTKPRLTQLGEMYYEGKEFEARVENAKPGILSDDLKK